MIAPVSELVVLALSLLVGWMFLWPLRGRLGNPGYHLSALPVGLLCWTSVAVASSQMARPFDTLSIGVGILAFIGIGWGTQWCVLMPDAGARRGVGMGGYVVSGGILCLAAAALTASQVTIASGDSWGAYWPLGVQLGRYGEFGIAIVADRGVGLVSLIAANAAFGGEWVYVVFPVLAMNLLLVLGALLLLEYGQLDFMSTAARAAVLVWSLLLLLTEASFAFNAVYVHSHMASALYLLVSLGALRMAFGSMQRPVPSGQDAWLFVSGVAAGGLTMLRPDGLAYVFIPVVLALGVLTTAKMQHGAREVRAFFAPLVLVVAAVYVPIFLRAGLWTAQGKLGGVTALILLIGLCVASLVPSVTREFERRRGCTIGGERLVVAAACLAALAFGVTCLLARNTAGQMLAIASENLLAGAGGWGDLWWWVLGFLVLSVLSGDARRPGSWTRQLFLAIVMFWTFSGVVFGSSHRGRLGWNDSLARVTFHILPVIVWYVGAVLGRALYSVQTAATIGNSRPPEDTGEPRGEEPSV